MADLTGAERDRHLHRMQDPGEWPRWPILPVKKQGVASFNDSFGIGIMVAIEGRLTHVYNTSMFGLKSGKLADQLDSMEKKEYTDYEAILDDGWVVD